MIKVILSAIAILSAIPLGLLLKYLTKEEKSIYNNYPYFPTFLWTLAILAAIFYSINLLIALTLTFMFILILAWSKAK